VQLVWVGGGGGGNAAHLWRAVKWIQETATVSVGKVFESIEHKPICFTTKSYVISFHVLSNCPHLLLNGYSTHIWRVIQVVSCLICNDM